MIPDSNRLSWRDANLVQTIQTNAGYYGDIGSVGHLDICVNQIVLCKFCVYAQYIIAEEKQTLTEFNSFFFVYFRLTMAISNRFVKIPKV